MSEGKEVEEREYGRHTVAKDDKRMNIHDVAFSNGCATERRGRQQEESEMSKTEKAYTRGAKACGGTK